MPRSNGYRQAIDVQYPISQDWDIYRKDGRRNFIILDDLTDTDTLQDLRSHFPVQADRTGFTYLGKRYEGEYCLLQIIPHPDNQNNFILSVSCNDSTLLRKCLFTRKVIIPCYANGYHPYWNNEALVFYQGKYFRIYEFGMELEEAR